MTTYNEIMLNFINLDKEYDTLVNDGKAIRASIFDILQGGVTKIDVVNIWREKNKKEYVERVNGFTLKTDRVMDVDSEGFQNLEYVYQERLRNRRKNLVKLQEGLLNDINKFFDYVDHMVLLYRLCEAGIDIDTKAGKYIIKM